jgi:hypothetical protein
MPGIVDRIDVLSAVVDRFGCKGIDGYDDLCKHLKIVGTHTPGFMTGRDVLQFVGTNIFRRMYNNVWVDSTIRRISADAPDLAIITDCRFPNECQGVQSNGGKVVRLTRSIDGDTHDSETILDKDKYDWNTFDAVLDNANITIEEQNIALQSILDKWNYLP